MTRLQKISDRALNGATVGAWVGFIAMPSAFSMSLMMATTLVAFLRRFL